MIIRPNGVAESVIMKPYGLVKLELFNGKGGLKDMRVVSNLLVNTGLAFITGRMLEATLNVLSHMAVGTGNTAAAGTQTALVTEVARVALSDAVQATTNVTDDTAQYMATFPAGTATGFLTEAMILNAASGGLAFNRAVFSVINKGANDSLTITWKIIIA